VIHALQPLTSLTHIKVKQGAWQNGRILFMLFVPLPASKPAASHVSPVY
jgi:hypothetical protein